MNYSFINRELNSIEQSVTETGKMILHPAPVVRARRPSPGKEIQPMQIEIDDFVEKSQQELLLWAIEAGEHVLITGPRGTGKTRLAGWAARRLNRHFEICHLGSAVDPESVLQGSTRLEDRRTVFTRSRFVEAAIVPNAVIALDEINRAGDPKSQGMLMSAMDEQRRLYLEQEAPGRQVVDLAPGVVIVATANIGPGYCGTEALDPALLDRMVKIRLEYSKREPEALRNWGLGDRETRRVMKIAGEVRKQHECGEMPDSISTRGLVRIARMLTGGIGFYEAFAATIGFWDSESAATMRTLCEMTR
jgi:MoxR-like ATPase